MPLQSFSVLGRNLRSFFFFQFQKFHLANVCFGLNSAQSTALCICVLAIRRQLLLCKNCYIHCMGLKAFSVLFSSIPKIKIHLSHVCFGLNSVRSTALCIRSPKVYTL